MLNNNNFFNANLPTNQNDIESRLDQAWTYINERNVSLAQQACQNINQDFPMNADGRYATSFLAFQLKQLSIAINTIDKAIHLQPNNLQWQYQKVMTLLSMSDKVQAIKLVENLKNQSLNNIRMCSDFAVMFTQLTDYKQASFYYQQALILVSESTVNEKQQAKQSAQLYFNLASIERYQGKIELAEQHLNQAILLNPQDYEAYLLRSSLKKQTHENNHIEQLEQLLSEGITHPIAKAQIHFSLAKELEDLALYSQSFNQLKQGAKTRRGRMQYDVEHDLSTLHEIRKTFNTSLFRNKANVITNL
ncbi:hypothetical protein L3081_11900 [Colwellia sp. MSW7]|uniref:Tetratricopeptide repeat protein n=1 Tax=Colwellia maritima TaxID=2912588 RepID=A0ABS9X133_9GAMM|nr:hypothetical protein [Colwellia maritima]MCI2283978.1 hypothetical protein [Colwellia maritima]